MRIQRTPHTCTHTHAHTSTRVHTHARTQALLHARLRARPTAHTTARANAYALAHMHPCVQEREWVIFQLVNCLGLVQVCLGIWGTQQFIKKKSTKTLSAIIISECSHIEYDRLNRHGNHVPEHEVLLQRPRGLMQVTGRPRLPKGLLNPAIACTHVVILCWCAERRW